MIWGYSKDFHFTSLFNASIAVFLLSAFSSTTKKTFPTTQMTNCWLVGSNSSSMSYFLLLLFPSSYFIFISFRSAVFFPISSCWHSNMQYCPVNVCTATFNSMQFIWPMFATTCNVAHDRWPHRFILNDIMLFRLVSFIPWHLFSFQITRDVS